MNSKSQSQQSFDIAIIGGGMVGISLALLLAHQKRWRIAVVESQPFDNGPEKLVYSPSFDTRSTALSWSSRKVFEKLALWDQLRQHLTAISQIHVSDRGHFGLARMQAEEVGVEALGYVAENSWLGSVLLGAATAADITLFGSTSVKAVEPLANAMNITLKESKSKDSTCARIDSKLLILADGTNSATAHQLGIQSHSRPYGHSAIIANISLQHPHQGVAYERFTDQGPMALLPLTDFANCPRAALVWTQPTDIADRRMDTDDDSFLNDLQQRFGFRLGQFEGVGDRVSYPLALTTAEEQVRRRLVIIGNAAHSLHPVAGQGFNLSLRDVATLASNLAKCPQGTDVGALENLQNYQRQQAADQRNAILFSDSLPKLFGLSAATAALGRNSGLLLMDLVPPLRNTFAEFGMGLTNPQADYG